MIVILSFVVSIEIKKGYILCIQILIFINNNGALRCIYIYIYNVQGRHNRQMFVNDRNMLVNNHVLREKILLAVPNDRTLWTIHLKKKLICLIHSHLKFNADRVGVIQIAFFCSNWFRTLQT